MSAPEILTTISIAVSAWTLLEVIRLGKDVAVLKVKAAATKTHPDELN